MLTCGPCGLVALVALVMLVVDNMLLMQQRTALPRCTDDQCIAENDDRPSRSFQRPLRVVQTMPDAQRWCCLMLKGTRYKVSPGCTHGCPQVLADSDAFMALPKRKSHCFAQNQTNSTHHDSHSGSPLRVCLADTGKFCQTGECAISSDTSLDSGNIWRTTKVQITHEQKKTLICLQWEKELATG